jgi:uncharacterized protein YuzE
MALRTEEVEEGVLADYDRRGALVGFELLGADRPDLVSVVARLKERFATEAPQLQSLDAVAG